MSRTSCQNLLFGCSSKELRDELHYSLARLVVRFLSYRLRSYFSEEVNPVGKCGRIGYFHGTIYVAMKFLFFSRELVAQNSEKLVDDC